MLVAELLASDLEVRYVVGIAELLEPFSDAAVDLFEAPDRRLSSILSTRSPQQIAAVATIPSIEPLLDGPLLAQVDMADPGNVGTMIRTAEAAGQAGVVLVGSCADKWNPKVVRASAGASFRMPVSQCTEEELFSSRSTPVVATVPSGGSDYHAVDLRNATICIGNEAHGLSPEFVSRCDDAVTIPLAGPTESLNAAAAAAVLVFAARDQRRAVTIPTPTRMDR
ncbi:MAG: RNA methyltransferase [Acidimicrobiales bacterium]|nr:RNA methyltransferase [Acidimicrobiales bacterium]